MKKNLKSIKTRLLSKYLIFSLGITLQSCSQKSRINQNENITAANIVQEITKQIKHYPAENIYGFNHNGNKCYFEILVNDLPAFRNFTYDVPDAFEINNLLNETGTYKVTYKLYPLNDMKDGAQKSEILEDDSDLKLNLYSYDLKNKNGDDVEHLKYEIPKLETKITKDYSTFKFKGSGKSYYENSFEIKVDVPYTLKFPFETSTDLRTLNKEELQKKVLKEYQNIREIYLKKYADGIAKLTYDRLKDDLMADYATETKVKAAWNQLNEIIIKGDVNILPIEKYKMQFFANRRLVALITDGLDPETRGGNALVCKIKDGEYKNSIFEIKHFYGDARSFSLDDNFLESSEDNIELRYAKLKVSGKVTSRLYHKVEFDYNSNEIIADKTVAICNMTRGQWFFIPSEHASGYAINESPSHSEFYGEHSLLDSSREKGVLNMEIEGNDPLVL